MVKRNSTYWQRRFRQLENVLYTDIIKLRPDIDRMYNQAQADIEKEIRAWYQRIAANNDISMSEARKLLSASELDEFKWSVEDYIKHGKENALDQSWMRQLENASAKYHISRLEALKFQTQQSLEKVYGNQLDMIDRSMRDLYKDGYYRTVFEIQKGFGIGWSVGSIDENKLEKIIRKPWAADGKVFSERIWSSRDKLVNELHTELTRMCITGAAPDQAIKNISKKMNTSRYNAGRLVMTEAAYFSSASQKDCFNDLDVEQYEICATLDSHTSEICQEMDGKVFDMKDYEPGVTAPPFHVFCRSCTVPYFNDEFTVGEMRAARGEDGKTYYVPANMKYSEWKRNFVDGKEVGMTESAKSLMGQKKVKYDAEKSYKIDLPEYESKINDALSEASLKVAKDGSNNQFEYAALIDLDTGKIVDYGTDNEEGSVGCFFKYIRNHIGGRFAMVHNHVYETEMSFPDVQLLANTKELEIVASVTNNGIINVVVSNGKKTKEYLPLKYEKYKKQYFENHPEFEYASLQDQIELELYLRDMVIHDYAEGGIRWYGNAEGII